MIEWKMCVPTSSVPSGGASDVRANWMSNTWSARISSINVAATTVGQMIGSVTRRKACHAEAPSIRAARPRSAGTWRSPPRNRIPRSGIARHVTAMTSATVAPSGV